MGPIIVGLADVHGTSLISKMCATDPVFPTAQLIYVEVIVDEMVVCCRQAHGALSFQKKAGRMGPGSTKA